MATYDAQGPRLYAAGYAPVAMVGDSPAFGVGEWRSPPGWRPQAIWIHRKMADGSVKGVIVDIQPPEYIRAGGAKSGRRLAPPKHLDRVRRMPKLVTPSTFAQEQRLRGEGGVSASEMPGEVIDMIIDCYGPGDLPPDVAGLCRVRIAEVERLKKATPARASTTASAAPKARAGRAAPAASEKKKARA